MNTAINAISYGIAKLGIQVIKKNQRQVVEAYLAGRDVLRWLPPVLHFPEPLNFTKGFLAHYDGLVPVLARWCYNSF